METLIFLFTHLPIIDLAGDLFTGNTATTTPGILYDVGQFLAGLAVVGKLATWVAAKTETTKDDAAAAWLTNAVSKAIRWFADLSSNNTRPKERA
jgi:hypothetical protein